MNKEMLKILVVVAIAFAGVAQAHAGNTAIDTCPFEITEPGNYFVAQDLGPCFPFGIAISASNVRLHLEGHTLTGRQDFGIPADGIPAIGVQNVKIIGPGTLRSFFSGVRLVNVDHSEVKEVTVLTPTQTANIAIHILRGTHNRLKRNVASGHAAGFAVVETTNNTLEENVAKNNGIGILLLQSHGNELRQNVITSPLFVVDSRGIVLEDSRGNRITENTTNDNADEGISLRTGATGNEIEENTAVGNGRFDLRDDNPDCDANVWADNTFVTSNQGCIH